MRSAASGRFVLSGIIISLDRNDKIKECLGVIEIKCTKSKNGNGESTQKIHNLTKYIDKKLVKMI